MKRILVLAAMGLGALYAIHLLAQDFNKIRQPVAKFVQTFISKRDVRAMIHRRDRMMVSSEQCTSYHMNSKF